MDERRKDDMEIRVLKERVDNWMETTTEYRKTLCSKIDIITEKMSNLPCKERFENIKGIKLQLRALWAITGGMVLAIISEWVKLR